MSTASAARVDNGSEKYQRSDQRSSFQNTCKYTITNYNQIKRLQKIRDDALKKQADPNDPIRFHFKDIEFVGMLCTDGSIDFKKRNVAIRGRDDGLLVAYELEKDGVATNEKVFGIQSVIHLAPYNDKIANIFHFQNSVPVSSVNCNVRQLLDRECPKWNQYRSRPRESVHHFLSSKISGRSSFMESRKIYNKPPVPKHWKTASEEVETIDFQASYDDVNSVIEILQGSGQAEYFNKENQVVHVTRVVRDIGSNASSLDASEEETELKGDDKDWLKFEFRSERYNRKILTSVGLFTVILEENKRDDDKKIYLHGVRKFASQVCYGIADIKPKTSFPRPMYGWYSDEEKAIEVIRAMHLKTNREFEEGGKFDEIAKKFNITYSPSVAPKRHSYSAHIRFNGNTILRGMEDAVIGRFQGAGFPKEEVTDMYLAATAALAYKKANNISVGCAILNSVGNYEFNTSILKELNMQDLEASKDPLAVSHRDMLALIDKENETVLFSERETGKPFAVYCKRRIVQPELSFECKDVPESCILDSNPNNFVSNALARLTFITAACRNCPGLAKYERTLRANWLTTERDRPEFNQNVHDLAWLSSCAKDSSNSFHWSVLPYS